MIQPTDLIMLLLVSGLFYAFEVWLFFNKLKKLVNSNGPLHWGTVFGVLFGVAVIALKSHLESTALLNLDTLLTAVGLSLFFSSLGITYLEARLLFQKKK